ncbi:LLM class flavin-dependent oxidoreductase [Leptolyngbya ohadii]|uniref:LLM class flavin-dependent oxidoreductase n=1 Tax=Leptolyngbya ohadii TaxID=1962290 RepID=UPI000B59ED83|nr:LLM class flavin-dependent oxidoreductase [Leptolyngbya ohadii]
MGQIHLAAFLIAGAVAHSHALWRHPETDPDFLSPRYYQRIAEILEQGKFDLVFFADRLAISDAYGRDFQVGVRYGDQDAVRLDPVPLLAMMAARTERIGLGATRSTTYYHPYQVARTFATLDQLTEGRSAWNVVTSVNDAEAQNFGLKEHLEHDRRYDRADEFLEVTHKLWNSWEKDALILDRDKGEFADPNKVNYVDHEGEWFTCRGPLNVPRSPQQHPVIIQAGASGRGREFAARWAEVIFTIQPTIEQGQTFYRDVKSRLTQYGRRSEDCKILLAIMPFIGETEAIALERQALHNSLIHPLVGLSTLASHLNVDLSQYSLDQSLQVETVEGMRSMFDLVKQLSRHEAVPLAEIGRRYGTSVLVPQIAGTPEQIADRLELWFTAQACDGFVISPAHLPGSFTEFVQSVIPLLQQRGLFRQEYTGTTLREHLELSANSGFVTHSNNLSANSSASSSINSSTASVAL